MSDRRPKSDAERLERHRQQSREGMQRLRDRRRRDMRCLAIYLPDRWLERMVEEGRLKDHELSDPEALGRVVVAATADQP